jgi:hypothetical protein
LKAFAVAWPRAVLSKMTGVGLAREIWKPRRKRSTAYVDIIRYLTIFCACMIPLLFFIPRPPKHVQAGH